MRNTKTYGIILAVTVVLYILFEWLAPRTVSWEASLKYRDKKPYGTYIFYESLEDLFPSNQLQNNRQNYYQLWEYDTTYNHNLIIIRPDFYTDDYSIDALLDYINEGNTVLLSAFSFDSYLKDTLGIYINSQYLGNNGQLISMNLKDYPNIQGVIKYSSITTFESISSIKYPYKILGKAKNKYPNYIRFEIGKGKLFIHTNPLVFTNFNILKKQTDEYTEHLVSYLPNNSLLWDVSLDHLESEDRRALRYILSETHLKTAYYIALFLFILYILFKAKREQRAIPVVEPLVNNSLELVDSVSQLYIHKKSHKNMADKIIRHFFDYLNTRFFIRSQTLSDDYIDKLSRKSGQETSEVKKLVQLIQSIRNSESISDTTLLELNSRIEKFKQAKNKKS